MNLTGKIVSLKEKEMIYSVYENDIISKISELCSEYGDLADSIVEKLNFVVKKYDDPYYNPLLERGIQHLQCTTLSLMKLTFGQEVKLVDIRKL